MKRQRFNQLIFIILMFLFTTEGCVKVTQPLSENSSIGISSQKSEESIAYSGSADSGLLSESISTRSDSKSISLDSSSALSTASRSSTVLSNSSPTIVTKTPLDYYKNQYVTEQGSTITFGVMKPINMYEPGEKIEYYFILDGDVYKSGTATVKFYNNNLQVFETKNHVFTAGSGQPVTGYFKATKNGVYDIKLIVPDTNRSVIFSVGVYPKAIQVANSSFYYGIQPYISDVKTGWRSVQYRDGYAELWQTIDWLGCNLVRETGVPWESMQKNEGAKIDFTMMDRMIKDSDSRDIMVDWCFLGTAGWAVMDKYKVDAVFWNKPPRNDVWDQYIRAVATHYKSADNIQYEIWNEPDWEFWGGTIDEYLTMLDMSVRSIKSIHPDAYVYPGGMVSNYDLSNAAGKDSTVYYSKYKELLDQKLIDNYAIHVHGPFDDYYFFDTFKRINDLLDSAGLSHNGSFINEAGTASSSDDVQAEELMAKILWSRANNYGMFVTYSYRDFAGAATKDLFCMMNSNLEPRESFIAYANLIRTLGQASYKEKVFNEKSIFADVYKAGNQYIVPVFASKESSELLKIRLGLTFEAFDIYGNKIAVLNNQLTVKKSVVYLVFSSIVSARDFSH